MYSWVFTVHSLFMYNALYSKLHVVDVFSMNSQNNSDGNIRNSDDWLLSSNLQVKGKKNAAKIAAVEDNIPSSHHHHHQEKYDYFNKIILLLQIMFYRKFHVPEYTVTC